MNDTRRVLREAQRTALRNAFGKLCAMGAERQALCLGAGEGVGGATSGLLQRFAGIANRKDSGPKITRAFDRNREDE